ncbi:hypothetical protein COLO4_08380 [Corchorus olitorius]|uniref:Uncharacterized protein n=1 Tax=Corchorus olitorius TaxID=93759 RepID=A0A1R3KG34_9ROSI|nr:hypothetical protein COLO4_08380 [Corchorus olitorius]
MGVLDNINAKLDEMHAKRAKREGDHNACCHVDAIMFYAC